MTIIYNTDTEKLESKFLENGYIVDNKPGKLNPNQVELAVVYEIKPTPNVNANGVQTQWVSEDWQVDLVAEEYRKVYTVNDYTAEQIAEFEKQRYIASLQWEQLEDDLETTFIPSTTDVNDPMVGETFFERAITTTNPNAYSLLLNSITDKWDKRIGLALNLVKASLPIPLTNADVDKLNEILANNNFNITIPY